MMKKYNKNVGQIVLRWHIQKYPERYSVIPKSSHPERVRGNLNVYDFELGEEWEGLWLMESDEIGGYRKVSLEEAEKIVAGGE